MNKPVIITSQSASTSKPIESSWRPATMNFDWSKADTVGYYECSRTELFNLHLLLSCNSLADLKCCRPDLFTLNGINATYRNVVHALLNASIMHAPRRGKSKFKKYWWDNSLVEIKKESVITYKEWLAAGKPKDGNIAALKKAAQKKYKYLIYGKRLAAKNRITNKLQDILSNVNKNKFWKVWKTTFNNQNQHQNIKINGLNDKTDIANLLAENIRNTCSPNDENCEASFKQRYHINKSKRDPNSHDFCEIEVESVDKIIHEMELNKACEFDNLSAEHIKYVHCHIGKTIQYLDVDWCCS